jgi:hypothetical protein
MSEKTDEWRQQRMLDLAERLGGRAPLGRALGYKDGAFVRQMIEGEKPITEKTVAKVERLPGCAGWFNAASVGVQPSSVIAMPQRLSIRAAVDLIADQLDQLSPEQRDVAQGLMHALARTPKAQLVRECFVTSLAGDDSAGNKQAVHR